MKNIKVYNTEKEYSDVKEKLEYPSVSYVYETNFPYIKEFVMPKVMTATHVIEEDMSMTLCNNYSLFKSITINNGKNLIKGEYEGAVTVNKADFISIDDTNTYYMPSNYISKTMNSMKVITSDEITENDYMFIGMNIPEYNEYFIMGSTLKDGVIGEFLQKIDDNTYVLHSLEEFNTIINGGILLTFGFIKNYEGIENDLVLTDGSFDVIGFNSNVLQHVVDSTIEYKSVDVDLTLLPSEIGEYVVTYELKKDVNEIPYNMFYLCSSLASIEIPNNVTSIGDCAFYICNTLSSITFEEDSQLTSIGEKAFAYCSSLSSIEIPNGVTSIGDEVFYDCDSLSSITIPNGVTSIGEKAFYLCRSLSSVTIPNSVTSIGDEVFYDCDLLSSITIPSSVTSIGDSAFYNCSSLSSIEIPSGVTSIGDSAFYYCNSLSSITCLALTAPIITTNTFLNVEDNGVLRVPQGSDYSTWMSSDSYYLGYYGWTLEEIDYETMTINYVITDESSSIGICNVFSILKSLRINDGENLITSSVTTFEINKENVESVYYEENDETFYVPSELISNHADYVKVIPNEEITNDDYLFILGDMLGEKMIIAMNIGLAESDGTFPFIDNILTISGDYLADFNMYINDGSYYAFGFIKNYEGIENDFMFFDDGNGITLGFNSNLLQHVVDSTIEYGNMGKILLPSEIGEYVVTYELKEDVNEIPYNMFNGCSSLASITFEEDSQLTSIGDSAFENCYGLSSIEIPSSVTSIGDAAFRNCSSLSSIEIPSGVTSIGTNVFDYCESLSSVIIGNSVTSIGMYAFAHCSSLSSITFEEDSQLTSIGDSAFENCYGLSSIEIPSSVTSIGDAAFRNCSSLSSIEIPSGVTSIGDSAFGDCSSLSSIEIPNSVTSIDMYAFYNCNSLSSITFEEDSQLTSIGERTFFNCYSLSSIEIPNSVTSIGDEAFYDCNSLSSITCLALTAPIITTNTFFNVEDNGVLRVPQGSDYSTWMSSDSYYLGYYNWTLEEI